MPIDVAAALAAPPMTTTVRWTEQDVMLYHLALGAGQRPTDPDELRYTYERNLQVLPTFAVVTGLRPADGPPTPGLRLPGIDVDLAAVLHGAQEVEVYGPVPAVAEGVTTSRVAAVYDKGKAAVIVLEASTADAAGRPLFTTRSQIFVRGEGGFGGDRGPSAAATATPPDRDPDLAVDTPTLPQQALLYRLCGDRNPLHADPDFAKVAGFERPILHGLCTYGMVCKAVVDACLDGDASRVAHYTARFAGVLCPGETIRTRVWRDGDRLLLAATVPERADAPVLSNAILTAAP